MRRFLRILLRVVAVILLVAGLFVGYACHAVHTRMEKTWVVNAEPIDSKPDAAVRARGEYLVTKVAVCVDCHGKNLGGDKMADSPIMGRLYAANLTSGAGGIGARYTDEDLVRVLLHGVRKDGHSVVFMPSQDWKFTEQDMRGIVAYLRSVPPVNNTVPEPWVGPLAAVFATVGDMPLLPAELIDHEHVRYAAPVVTTDPAGLGAHLVQTAGCTGCHTPTFEGGSGPPPGAANITPVGIGTWTEKDFVTALRTHRRPDGSKIADTMPLVLGGMADEDLSHIFAFLRTLPAKGQKTKHQLHPDAD
jgi:cytochrome c553